MIRLDKYLAHYWGLSRSEVSKILREGNVTIDGNSVSNGALKITMKQKICYDGEALISLPENRYFMLNKPAGYVCSTDDPQHPTVLFFINEPMTQKLHAAGRLDLDTTGLVLLTDDGKWSHKITSPKHHCSKTYRVEVDTPLNDHLIDCFEQGILLKGEKMATYPATLDIIDAYHARVTLREGRYHQVKRMFAAVGNHVKTLHRERIGNIQLDVEEGTYRSLTQQEVDTIFD